jgi:cytochrome c oxidase subunit 4
MAASAAAHDDHGHSAGHHHILSGVTLSAVLAILLFFTVATVGAANFEKWVATEFNLTLPLWINVFIALSIATVKSILVLAFFMNLKNDNPVNSLIFGFTILAFALFMFFTIVDLGSRGLISPFKAPQIVAGGTGANVAQLNNTPVYLAAFDRRMETLTQRHLKPVHGPMVQKRMTELLGMTTLPPAVTELVDQSKQDAIAGKGRELTPPEAIRTIAERETLPDALAIAKPKAVADFIKEFEYALHHGLPAIETQRKIVELIGPEKFNELVAHAAAHGGHGHGGHADSHSQATSSANQTRPRTGQTPGLFDAPPRTPGAHGAEAAPAHGSPEAKPAAEH